ncbi:MAG: hypothetical protein O3C21_06900 [Verrucomicrobia bacterium]|nr:hypothetical protein [Verrucomicrobiota bacterium]
MTFSDAAVVKAIEANFIPVWESIAPVSTVTYHLDSERSVKGIVNGEIAVYFCRPDGKVFDILPGLHAPESLLKAMDTALHLYTSSDRRQNLDHIRQHHIRQHHAAQPESVFSQQQFVTLNELPDRSETALQKKEN